MARTTHTTLMNYLAIAWILAVFVVAYQQIQSLDTPSFALPAHHTTPSLADQKKPIEPFTQSTSTPPISTPPTSIQTAYDLIKSDIANTQNSVHAPTIAHIHRDNHTYLMSAWFEGSREGAKDVQIYAAFLDLHRLKQPFTDIKTPLSDSPLSDNKPNHSQAIHRLWSSPKPILSRQQLATQSNMRIKKLGNPVLYQSTDSTIHLFVVATSYGGWAASKIFHLTSKTGDHFVLKQLLPLSPFLNVSHLVRTLPVTLDDGGFYLPVYHELIHKFELILRFDHQGNLIAKTRPNALKGKLQPALTTLSKNECLSASRHHHSEYMLIQYCTDGGINWHKPMITNIKNDNNSLNLLHADNQNYIIHNQRKNNNDRHDLWLSTINNHTKNHHTKNNHTNHQFTVEPLFLIDHADIGEVSYPSTIMADNHLHIVYTHDRNAIRHVMINKKLLKTINQHTLSDCITQDKQISAYDLKTNSQLFYSLICQSKL